MLEIKEHETLLNKILFSIYSDKELALSLGFKGGTACYLFYNLPRFSTDLDFNLLKKDQSETVFRRIKEIIKDYGVIKDSVIKANTIFFLLSYNSKMQNIKIEISQRIFSDDNYEIENYLGLPVLVMAKDCIFAHKLTAVLDRKKPANRDLFDVWFFLKNNWPINKKIIKTRTGLDSKKYLKKIISYLEKHQKINILHSLGELINDKQKSFVKYKLISELLFLLKLYVK